MDAGSDTTTVGNIVLGQASSDDRCTQASLLVDIIQQCFLSFAIYGVCSISCDCAQVTIMQMYDAKLNYGHGQGTPKASPKCALHTTHPDQKSRHENRTIRHQPTYFLCLLLKIEVLECGVNITYKSRACFDNSMCVKPGIQIDNFSACQLIERTHTVYTDTAN